MFLAVQRWTETMKTQHLVLPYKLGARNKVEAQQAQACRTDAEALRTGERMARRFIGVVPQYNTLDRACTVAENLQFHCSYFGMSRAEGRGRTAELLDQFRLTDRAQAYPQQLSGGLAQRVQIARAIAHRPKVLFLDEPSAGLDPQSRIAMWEAVRGLREQGITVVLTTHYMEEADELCDRLAIVRQILY